MVAAVVLQLRQYCFKQFPAAIGLPGLRTAL
jgi:hypothetical protein